MRFLVIFSLLLSSLSINAETIKIGYIDTEQIVNSLPQYKQSTKLLADEFEPKKQELLDLFNYITLIREKIKTINESEEKTNLQIELSKLKSLENSFKQETEFWQETMNIKKIELLQKIELLINNTINEIAITENYDLILYENAAFVSENVNITEQVIEKIQKLSL